MSPRDSTPSLSLDAFLLRWSVALFAGVGLVIGMVLFSLRAPVYESRSVTTVINPLGTMQDEVELVLSDAVLGAATASLDTEPDIDVEANEVADLLTITVRADDPDDAARIATQVTEAYVQAQSTTAVAISSAATPDPSPVAPDRLIHLLAGTTLGALIGAGITGLQRIRLLLPARTQGGARPDPIRPAREPSSEFAHQMVMATDHEPVIASAAEPFAPEAFPIVEPGTGETSFCEGAEPAIDVRDAVAAQPRLPLAAKQRRNLDLPGASTDMHVDATPFTTTSGDQPDHRIEPASVQRSTPTSQPPTCAKGDPTPHVADADLEDDDPSRPAPLATPPTFDTPGEESDVSTPSTASQSHTQAAVAEALGIARAKFEARLADAALAHQEHLSTLEAEHERQVADFKRELADARKVARTASAQAQRVAGHDEHRVGDLQAQVDTLENEISGLRSQLEAERITHVRELTQEREAADQALDDARRSYREQIEANDQVGREALRSHRSDLDDLLARQRADHQAELDRQHTDHEDALARLRQRRTDDLSKLTERHQRELAASAAEAEAAAEQLAGATRQTITELRASEKRLAAELEELRQGARRHRSEVGVLRSSLADLERKYVETEQTLRHELAEAVGALESERERNAALRDDVVRRTAEAHQAVDRAIEDRSEQLAELETLVARQRAHAERRVSETIEAAEERARAAAKRESELQARIDQLERTLGDRRPHTG